MVLRKRRRIHTYIIEKSSLPWISGEHNRYTLVPVHINFLLEINLFSTRAFSKKFCGLEERVNGDREE